MTVLFFGIVTPGRGGSTHTTGLRGRISVKQRLTGLLRLSAMVCLTLLSALRGWETYGHQFRSAIDAVSDEAPYMQIIATARSCLSWK